MTDWTAAGKKAWATRRANQAKRRNASLKAWETMRKNPGRQAALKAWRTMRRNKKNLAAA